MSGAGTSVPVHYLDDHRPRCHLAPPAGWMNDPNGPVFYKGRYHMFYQHLPNACEWDFGIVWGHAVSLDLVTWQHLPPALIPTPGWVDADGCFSGCCIIDPSGRPIILYTGVRLRSNTSAGPLPPPEQDLGMVWIESQCAAIPADPTDDLLINWKKIEAPFLPLPPKELQLTGWRDPFIFTCNTLPTEAHSSPLAFLTEREGESKTYRMMIGSGIKGKGGTALVYKSNDLVQGWELEGTLCEGNSEDTGVVWECPLLVPLMPVPSEQRSKHPTIAPPWLHAVSEPLSATALVAEALEVSTEKMPLSPRQQFRIAAPSSTSLRQAGGMMMKEVPSPFAASPTVAQHQQQNEPSPTTSSLVKQQQEQQQQEDQKLAVTAAFTDSLADEMKEKLEIDTKSSFEFDSGAASGALPGSGLDREGSVELWQSSPESPSPSDDKQKKNTNNNNNKLVAEVAAKLERAATLEHWTLDQQESAASSSVNDRSSSKTNGDNNTIAPTIGSTLGSIPHQSSSDSELNAINATITRHTALKSPFNPPESGDDDSSEDRFAIAHSRVPALQVKIPLPSFRPNESIPCMPSPVPPNRQWHFFTVSPDAPTNPVLYWTGFMSDPDEDEGLAAPQFQLETAKGPFRLDLGDILYAPNVCQDENGRWLLWGWLQERRKMGTYSYAGCLSLPRVLHATDQGRLVQAPAEEVAALRKGKEFHAQHVTLYPEAVVPIQQVSGDRLDIQCTIERGSAMAAGLLFRSHEAEAEGSTAIVYDWDRNQLEAIFNVPPNWQPCGAPPPRHLATSPDVFEEHDGAIFDAADYLCGTTPKFSNISRQPSLVFSPSLTASPQHPDSFSPQNAPVSGPGGSESHVSSATGSPLSAATAGPMGIAIKRSGSSLSQVLQRSNSFVGLAGSLATTVGSGGLARTSSTLGTSLSRMGSFIQRQTSFIPSSPHSQHIDAADAAELDAELSTLLEDLAAPMRGAAEELPPPPQEPRRVGGPLLMRPADRLHLRIIVDHSLVEVFTGTGEVLSTRIYRGRMPEDISIDAGIEFVAFGGAAILEKVSVYEIEAAWEGLEESVPTPRVSPAMAAAAGGSGSNMGTPMSGAESKSPFGAAGDRADDLFDEILMGIDLPGTTTVGGQ